MPVYIEPEIIPDSVIVQVQDCIALRSNGNALLRIRYIESRIMMIFPIGICHIVFVAITHIGIRYGIAYRSIFNVYRFFNVVMLFIGVAACSLRPEDDCISGCCIGFPLCIDFNSFTQAAPECKFIPIRASFIRIPSTELIAVSFHRKRRRFCNFIVFNKLWRVICSTLTILIEDQPMSFRRTDGECHVSCYGNGRSVFNYSFCSDCRRISNVFKSLCHIPSIKIVSGVCRSINHIDCIIDTRCFIFRISRHLFRIRSKRRALFVQICDHDDLVDCSVIGNFFSVCHTIGKHGFDLFTDIGDSQHRIRIIRCIPSAEHFTGIQVIYSRIIQHS